MKNKPFKYLQTNISSYDNSWYKPGGSTIKRLLWYFTNVLFFANPLIPISGLKVVILRMFGATIGKGVNIKPNVQIKYPWHLEIGDYVWIGENVWIDNLTKVTLGSNCCISQGAMLLTGNHNYKKSTFDLMVGEINIEEGVWIGAQATVCPGITCSSHSILTVGSTITKNMEAYSIYQGNPAIKIKDRDILE